MRSLILSFSLLIAATLIVGAQSNDCNTATMLGAADLTSGVATAGATTADNTASGFWGAVAPLMANSCDPGGTFIVDEWYRFDVAANNDITIELTAGTPHMAVILEATTPNCGTPNLNNFLACHDPAIATNPQTFHNCFSAGSTYYIVILTSVGNEGPYDLTVTEENGTSVTATGDNCAAALALPLSTTDGTTITCGANNVNGTTFNNFQEVKGDALPQPACIELNEATIWYSFTAGDDVYIENTSSTNLSIALYSGSCGALTLEQCDPNGNISLEDVLIPNATYYLQVAYPYGDDATFDFCINSPILPTVDDCATPEILVLVDGSTTSAVQMDNLGSGSTGESFTPGLIAGCGTGSMSTNYYQFTIGGAGNTHLNINYNETGATPISNSQITILQNCTDAAAFMAFEWTGNTDENVCLMPGTYLIQIASCDLDEGTFTLALTPNTPPSNDDCSLADLFIDPVTLAAVTEVPAICETYNVTGTTISACPEASDLGTTCTFSTESTVWYTFTTSAALNQLAEITLNPSGGVPIVQGTFALFSGACGATTLEGTCQTDGTEMNISLTPSTTYFIAVSQDALGTTGTFDIDLEISSIPTNDDCNLATNPDIILETTGSTNCAVYDVTSCGIADPTMDHQVFYIYSNTTGSTVDLQITIEADPANGNPATQISITAVEDDCTTFTGFYPAPQSNSEWCDILGMGMQTLPCIEDGETIILLFGSVEGDEGDFTITAVEGGMQPIGLNDECDAPLDVTPANTCVWETVTADNNNACPEDFGSIGLCNFDVDPVVWYSVTVPVAPGTYQLDIQNITDAASYLTIFDVAADCDLIAAAAINADCEMGAGPHGTNYDDLTPGATYLIAFGNPTPGMYTFEIKLSLLPSNDECADGEPLADNTPTDGTTSCATQEMPAFNSGVCLDSDEENTVWYEVTVTAANKGFNLTVTGNSTNPIAGGTDINAVVFETTAAGCVADGTTFVDEVCATEGTLTDQFECIGEGTYLIRISTSDANSGDFSILFEQIALVQPNDNCDAADAVVLNPGLDCMWMPTTATTVDACPEDMFLDPTDCGIDEFPVVWYSVTAPATATLLDLQITGAGSGTPFMAVYEDGADCSLLSFVAGSTCYSGIFTDLNALGQAQITVTAGTTYLIAVGTNDLAGSTIDFEIKWITPPVNDECAGAEALTASIATDGTTACATQPVAGEYNSTVCLDADETNTVFYTYEVPPTDKGFNVTITAAATNGLMGDINLVVFEDDPVGTCATGTGADIVDEVCTASTTLNEEFECVGPGTYVIRVSTSGDNEGDFQITITPLVLEQPNDNCDAADAVALNPGLECMWMEITANSVGACPEDIFLDPSACGLSVGAVVWYEITAPVNATFLDIRLTSGNGANPMIAVFPGNPVDCDNQTFVAGSTCYESTFTDLISNGNTLIPVIGGDTYLIAVGVTDPNGSMIDFGIRWITPPVNDECVDAVALVGATPVDGTTACATQPLTGEYNSTQCTDADETNTVFYTYEVPDTDKGFNVTISASLTNPLMGDINLVVFEDDPVGACATGPGAISIDDVCTTPGTLNDEFECIGAGTYVIRISTSSVNEGGFSIEITPLALEQPNDNCDSPDVTAFMAALECEWMVIDADTQGACPEDTNLDPTDCGIDDFPVTWYEVTAPANAQFLDLQINFGGVNPFLAVYEVGVDCDNLTFVAGSTCYSGTFGELNDLTQPLIDVIPGTTYLIAVGTDALAGGTINFGIKWITPPDNDECVDAEDFDNLMPSGNPGEFSQTYVMETTQCATGPLTSGPCDDDKTNTVWYTYTVEPDVKEITIDISNWMNTVIPGGTPDFSILVLDMCPDGGGATILTQADGTAADYCGGEGTDLITLSCLDEGDVITIMVSSTSENEGTFDITLNTAEPDCVYTNDECPDAVDFGVVIMDDPIDCVFLPGCNDLACTEFDFSGVCPGIDVLNSVFYTFTTDDLLDVNGMPVDAAFVNLEVIGGQVGELDDPGAILLSGDCNSLAVIAACAGTGGGGEFNSGPLGMPGQILPNTTYTVIVYNSNDMQNGGTFDLCITVTSGCVNDDICDAFTLEPGVTVDNPASSNNCTDDFVLTTGCDNTLSSATLWYQIEVPAGASSIIVTLNNQTAPDGVEGEVSIAVGPLVDCNALDVNDILYEDCSGFATNVHEIDCAIEFGTYWIQIGSDDEMESGDFTIEYTFSSDGDPENDLCTEATDLVVNEFCEFTTFGSTLKGACVELFDVGPCEYSMNQAVWFTITIPTGDPMVTDMDIMIEGLANPMIGVFEFECMDAGDPSANNGIINAAVNADGAVDCSQMPLTEGIVVVPGTTYHILVSTSTMENIIFDISIKLNAPPINDDPCITQNNPPIDLTGGGSHSGTTCCARGPKDPDPLGPGNLADFQNADCSAQTEDASVWYTYIPDENDDGYNLILEDGGANGPMSLEYYFGPPDGGCTGNLTLLGSSCNSNTADIKIGNCFEPGDVLFVKVTTDDADTECGDFIFTIVPASCGEMSDDCIDTADTDPIMPVTNEQFMIDYVCVQGCLDYACPEDDAMGGCGQFIQAPTVWFQVEADMLAAQMFTTVEAFGNWDPVWSIWSGTTCDDLEIVNFGGAPPCSNGDATPALHQVGVFEDIPNYWIAITLDPNSLPSTGLDDGSFELCVATTINAIICLGEEIGDCTDPSLVMEVTDREVEDQPLTGPFCQGEEVTINIQFDYDASESGADWLIGMVPIFGDGWDLTQFVYADNAPVGNGLTSEWYVEGSATAPIIQEPNPILCTFVNADGDLTLCNQLCDPCSDCPQSGMFEGDPLPSGYFWVTNGGNPGCDNDGSPGEGWGIGSTQASIQWEFTLVVKTFTDPADCFEQKDLSISFQTFSDGVGGCWEDPVGECILDRAMFSPAWEIECEAPPAVEGPDQEICHDGMVNIEVATVDGSGTQIQVDVEDNPNVTGEMSHTFDGGFGTIDDDLLNLTNDIQIVIYNVYSVDETLPCPGVVNQIEVTLYPELMVTFPPVFICEGDCTDITPDIAGGFGAPYMYEWSTGESTASINVCPVVPTTYFVTVTDGLGCEDIGEVEVDVKPPVELLLPASIAVCKDNNFDPFNPDYVVCLDFISGSSPFNVTWVTEVGLAGEPTGFAGECFAINEVLSSAVLGSPAGTYTLTANVTDFFGCMGTTDMVVNITGELTIVADVNDYACGETETTMSITGLDAAGNSVNTFLLYGGCPDDGLGDFIDEYFSTTGTVLTTTLFLLDYTCYTIVAQTESGCQATIDVEIPLTEGTSIDIGGDEAVCIGSDATITIANEGEFVTFDWTPNIGSTGSVTFTPDSTATYIVEVTDAIGCVSQALWTVEVNPEPTISLAGALQFCENGTATITSSGGGIGGTYAWTGIAGAQTGASYTTGVEGNATVTVTDINGCDSDSTITFVQVDVIEIILANSNICDGMGDTLFVPSNIINVVWEDATPMVVSDTSFYIITTSGTFTVTGQDATTGCDAAGSFTVQEFITPIISIPDTVEVCRLDSGIDSLCIDLVAIASGSDEGTWSQGGIIPGFTLSDFPLNDVCFTGIQTGCYPFKFTTNTATLPCTDTVATMMVCVKACPCPSPATKSIPDICNFGTYNLENAELTSDAGTWSVQSGPSGQDITGIISGTIFTATGILPGSYLVRFTLDNPGGGSCMIFSEQIINVVGQNVINAIAQGQLCNIDGQQFPTSLDLFNLISVDASNGGTWVQTGTETVLPITGGSMISSVGITDFTEVYTFEYTSGDTGGPCPPTVTSVTVDIFDCTCPIVIVGMDTLCNDGVPIDLFTLLTNDDNLTGAWTTNGNLVGASMFDPNGLPSGAYNITYTLDSSPGPGCEVTYSNIIIVRRRAIAEMQQGPQPCTMDTGNGPTTVNLYNWLVPGYTLGSWSQTGGDVLPLPDDGNSMAVVDFVNQDIGETFTYVFTTVGAQEPCQNTSVTIVITVVDCNCPPIMITDQDPICNDAGTIDLCALVAGSDPGSFIVTSAGGTEYPERIDASGCIFDAVGINQGTYTICYTLDATVSGTCVGTLCTTVEIVNYISTEIVMNPDPVCSDPDGNGLMILNFTTFVGNAGSGSWSDDDGAGVVIATISDQQSVSFVGVPAGSYDFTYTIDNAEPCPDQSLTVTVEVTDDCNCAPINPADPADVCSTDGPVDLTQYDDVDMPGTWSSTDLNVQNGNSLITDGVAAGVYTLTYTLVTPIPDCPDSTQVMILIGEPANPGIPAEDLTLCEGDVQVINLDDRLTDADLGGLWTETSATMSTGFTGNTFDTDGQVAGTYTFQYTLSESDPCPEEFSTVTVIINPNPDADAGSADELDCMNISEDLGGSGTSIGADFVYSWTLGGVEVGTDAILTGINVEGTYQLLVTNSVTGCVDSSSVTVTKSDAFPEFIVDETNITCNGDNDGFITISGQNGGDGNYTYSLNGGTAVSDPGSFTGLAAGDYTIAIIDGIGCTNETVFTILEPDPVSVVISADGLVDGILKGELGDEFILTIDPVAENIDSVVWSDFNDPTIIFCSGSAAECTTVTIAPTLNTTVIYVEVFDANGCPANDQVQIQLNQIVDVVFPNIITPNGDNINDFFYIASDDVEQVLDMKIFDRWGELIWEKQEFNPRIPSEGWNGKFNDSPVVPGVYVFTVEVLFNDLNSTRESFSGDVTVTDGD